MRFQLPADLFEKVWRLACYAGFLFGREAARRMLARGEGTILFTGATASVGRDVHQIANWSRAYEPLITLHVYSPPLSGVQIYRGTKIVPVPAARFAARQATAGLEDCA